MTMKNRLCFAALCSPLLWGCADNQGPNRDFEGPGVEVTAAALTLEGVGDVLWDIEVVNGLNETVWNRRVSSSTFGNSEGAATYVGPCDADTTDGANANTVKVWVVGAYDADIAPANTGSFNAGSTAGVGAVTGTAVPFQNPTAAGPLTRAFTCLPNQDVFVEFNVTMMRPAEQGFFDIAVNFDNIFCSAKYDCCYDTNENGCAVDGSEDIDLLHDTTGRGKTHVLAFACTAGTAASVDTQLYLDDIELDCGVNAPGTPLTFDVDLLIDPDVAQTGNQCALGDLSACVAHIAEIGTADADTFLFQSAVYQGAELLPNNGGPSANLVYWNVALGVKAPISNCVLRTRATVDNAAGSALVSGGSIAAGNVYPYIQWDVNLGTCGSEPLTFGNPAAPVRAEYTPTTGGGLAFDHLYP